jgi:glyoxylase-like metal-dependent hydrolase (beta-lactamase superfamily II)
MKKTNTSALQRATAGRDRALGALARGGVAAALLASACASTTTPPAPPTKAAETTAGPPAGLGRRDDAATLGPFAHGPLTVRAHRSAEYSAAVNSWVLETATEVALIDAQLVMPEAEKVAALLRSTGKKLAWVWISHAHPDHYAGLQAIAAAFPGVPLYARASTVEEGPALLKKFDAPLQKFFPGEMASGPVALTPYTSPTLKLGEVEVQIVDLQGGEHTSTTMLVVPSQRIAFTGDLVYNRVHPWLNELDDRGVLAHLQMLEGRADIDVFYPGHGQPFAKAFIATYRGYVNDFLAEVPVAADANDLIARMWRRYPDWQTLAGLRFSANAYIGARATTPK